MKFRIPLVGSLILTLFACGDYSQLSVKEGAQSRTSDGRVRADILLACDAMNSCERRSVRVTWMDPGPRLPELTSHEGECSLLGSRVLDYVTWGSNEDLKVGEEERFELTSHANIPKGAVMHVEVLHGAQRLGVLCAPVP